MNPERKRSLERTDLRILMMAAAGLYLVLVALTFFRIKALNDGHFVYALDDPYIHLALSEQIAHGHYGINPGEASSPSSSVIWPFLLTAFAGQRWHIYVPLALNVVFGLAAVVLIAFVVDRWPPFSVEPGLAGWSKRLFTILLLMMAGNLVSLTFVGMETVLQCLLAIACAAGLMVAWDEHRVPYWCLAAAAIGPMVRYEGIALSLAVCMVLLGLGQMRRAIVLLALSILPLVLFGLFLQHLGLPFLPMSILTKGGAYQAHPAMDLFRQSYLAVAHDSSRWRVLAIGVILAFALVSVRDRVRRAVLGAGVLVAGLHLAVGQFGWFHRYEVYALLFLTLILVRLVNSSAPTQYGVVALALFYLASPYISATGETAPAAHELYLQQYQMHRFITDFYHGDVAVTDLGMVSDGRPAGMYVLDLEGLASPEVARTRNKSADWLEEIVRRHGVRLAIVYADSYNIPASWAPLANMCETKPTQIVGETCVMFYSTSADSAASIREDLRRFAPTLPRGIEVDLDPSTPQCASKGL
jgi:hypothetical protein